MHANKTESLHFYHYLCQKFGSEKEVKVRRLTFMAADTSSPIQISSGSKCEGLNLKGSDVDLMFVSPSYKVYEYEKEIVQSDKTVLVMDTADTQPCFTRLRLYSNYNRLRKSNREVLKQHGMKYLMSNQLFKQKYLKFWYRRASFVHKIHGPCISDDNNKYDYAFCLKCDKWISQAVPWINRPRSSWLSPQVIYRIIMTGVLFVPIGFKDSINEDLEWRVSFSVEEKLLIFVFNHTQLLCYALLKIVLKEIIEKDEGLKGLLCSYYIKTLIFWILDDTNTTVWRPDNIIPCFMACLQRLLYCVEYSTLLHYFIPDINFVCLRSSTEIEKKKCLTNMLNNLFQQGIQCFSASETLHDYTRFFQTTTNKQCNITSIQVNVRDVLEISKCCPSYFQKTSIYAMRNRLLHHCKTNLSDIFIYYLSMAHQYVPQTPYTQDKQRNKKEYAKYKYDLSHLLIGVHSDAVVGWLMLASFFYVHGKYKTSLKIINEALSHIIEGKYENDFETMIWMKTSIILTPKQKSAIDMLKNEKLITILKSLTISQLIFECKSKIIPKELHLHVITSDVEFQPLTYAHFLRFLCLFHLHDHISCRDALQQLLRAIDKTCSDIDSLNVSFLHSLVFVGMARQMISETYLAKKTFEFCAKYDDFNVTTAEKILRELRLDF